MLCAEAADVAEEEILGSDLYVYNRDKGRIMGADDSLIGSPRLDDLQCAYATLRGFSGIEAGRIYQCVCAV